MVLSPREHGGIQRVVGVMSSHVVAGSIAGACVAIVHVLILGTGGLYVLASPVAMLLSVSRYTGILSLTGAGLGALVGFVWVVWAWWGGRRGRGSHVTVTVVFVAYGALWAVFLAKELWGKAAVPAAAAVVGVLSAGVVLTLFVRRPAGRRAHSHGRPRLGRAMFSVATGIVLLVIPAVVPGRATHGGDLPGNPLDEHRETASNLFASRAREVDVGRWNLLLLSIDTLRADHLGCYGYERPTSPAIDSLAHRGMLLTNVICQRPKTSPSVATIMTGTYPSRHGIHEPMQRLAARNLALAEVLKDDGWETAAVITNGNLYPAFGFDQGFDTYIYGHKDARTGADSAVAWINANAASAQPWFLWVHFTDPHTPYGPPEPFATMFSGPSEREQQIALYDGEIRYADSQCRRIWSALGANGVSDHTLVVFTADHGESLGEHNYYYSHGLHPYEPSARIPLIVAAPGVILPGGTSGILVGGVDILPTVLDALGVDVPAAVQGRSFLPGLVGLSDQNPREFVFLEAGYHEHDVSGRVQTLRRPTTKFVHRLTAWARQPAAPFSVVWTMNARLEGGLAPDELYDLVTDPGETTNLIRSSPDVAAGELQWLERVVDHLARDGLAVADSEPGELDPETLKSLKSLGYIK